MICSGFRGWLGRATSRCHILTFPLKKKKLAVKLVTDNSSINHCNSIIYSTVLWNASCKQGFKINKKNVGKKGNLCLLVGSSNFKHKSGSFSFPHRLNLLLTSLLNLSSGLCIYSADRLSAALSAFVVIHCLTDCLGTHTAAGFVQYLILLTTTNISLSLLPQPLIKLYR